MEEEPIVSTIQVVPAATATPVATPMATPVATPHVTNKKNNTRKMVETFVSNIDVTKDYSLEEVKKIVTDAYKSVKKTKKSKSEDVEKRQPSKYNLFVKEQMLKIKAENPTKDNKEIMSIAASLWKDHKLANP